MNNLNLQKKIFLILLLPLITILILTSISISNKYEKNVKMNESLEYIYFLENVSLLIHDLQKERKITTLYVESYGKKYDSEFKIQMTKTDESIDMLNKFLKRDTFTKTDKSKEKISNIEKNITEIIQIRQKIQNLQISKLDLEKFYTQEISNLSYFIDELISFSNIGN